jgi:multicomponent Na+:H+ antiporter subunit G
MNNRLKPGRVAVIAELLEWVTGLLLIVGALFSALAALGVLRFPDVYTRLHAAAKAGTVGAGFVLLAIAVASPDLATALRALLGIGFLVLTGPISAHLLARAAFLAGYRPADVTGDNDYKNVR